MQDCRISIANVLELLQSRRYHARRYVLRYGLSRVLLLLWLDKGWLDPYPPGPHRYQAETWRNANVILTSIWRRNVVSTYQWRFHYAVCPALGSIDLARVMVTPPPPMFRCDVRLGASKFIVVDILLVKCVRSSSYGLISTKNVFRPKRHCTKENRLSLSALVLIVCGRHIGTYHCATCKCNWQFWTNWFIIWSVVLNP